MGKGAKQKGNKMRVPQKLRKKLVEEVFKKGKKQRDLAKKLDEKLSRRHLKAGANNKTKFNTTPNKVAPRKHRQNVISVAVLDKKLAGINQVRRPPPQKNAKVGPMAVSSAIDCFTRMQLD